MSNFEVGKFYPLRNDEAVVEVVVVDLRDPYKGGLTCPVGGIARYKDGSSELLTWTLQGQFDPKIPESGLDLMPTPINGDGQPVFSGYIRSLY